MFCGNCGTEINDRDNFCYNCGQGITRNNYENKEEFKDEPKENIDENDLRKTKIHESYKKKTKAIKNNSFIKKLLISIIISVFVGIAGYIGGSVIISENNGLEIMEYLVKKDLMSEAKSSATTSSAKKYIRSKEFKESIEKEAIEIVYKSTDIFSGYYLERLLNEALLKVGVYSGILAFILYWYQDKKKIKEENNKEFNTDLNNTIFENTESDLIFNDNNEVNNKINNDKDIVSTKFVNSIIINKIEKSPLNNIIEKLCSKFNISKDKIRYDKIIFTVIITLFIIIYNILGSALTHGYSPDFTFKYMILVFSGIVAGPIFGGVVGFILGICQLIMPFIIYTWNYPLNNTINIIVFTLIGIVSQPIYKFISGKLFKKDNKISIEKNKIYIVIAMFLITIIFYINDGSFILGLLLAIFNAIVTVVFLGINKEGIKSNKRIDILHLLTTCLILNLILIVKIFVVRAKNPYVYMYTSVVYIIISFIYYAFQTSIIVILGRGIIKFILKKFSKFNAV